MVELRTARAPLPPGKRDTLLRLVSPAPATQDSFGAIDAAFSDPGLEVWALVRGLTATEMQAAKEVIGVVTHQIVIPKINGITPRHKFTNGARTFDIVGITGVDDRLANTLDIMAKEAVT